MHDYPFCWRAEEDPLIQYPRKSWFIRTTAFKEKMLANNSRINWLPEHIKDGRFGNFLETNVDWALSRERYWGTPLPIWVCEKTGYTEAVGSYEELLAKPGVSGTEVWEKAKAENPGLPDDLKVHKPYIDAVTYDSPKAPGARMRRVTGGDRLLVRFRGDAVRPMGISEQARLARSSSATSFPPISSARPSIRPAAGSTVCWRSARCCSERREGEGRGEREAAVAEWPVASDSPIPRSLIPTPPSPLSTLPSLPPSLPQLHRARA